MSKKKKRNKLSGRRTGTNQLPVVGKTIDGKQMVAGVYEFHEAHGLPLEVLFEELKDRNLMVDWIDLYKWAVKNNMDHEAILNKIREPIEDCWGAKYSEFICNTLTFLKINGKL